MKKIQDRYRSYLVYIIISYSFFFFQCDESKKIIEVAPTGLHGIYGYNSQYSMNMCNYNEIQESLFSLGYSFNKDIKRKNYYTINNFMSQKKLVRIDLEIVSKDDKCIWYLRTVNGLKTADNNIFEKNYKRYKRDFEDKILSKLEKGVPPQK